MSKIKNNLKILELASSPRLIISKELQTKITYLHNKVGKDEWSGILLYKIVSGDIKDPDNFILKAEDLFLKDIGTSTYTEYEFDENDLDMYEEIPNAIEMKLAHIHSHHNMQTFFSSTDTQELQDNAPNHNYYLSLIVNFDCQWCAKIAFIAEKTGGDIIFNGSTGNKETLKLKGEKVLVTLDCTIELEVDEIFKNRFQKIKEEKEKKEVPVVYNNYMYNNFYNKNDDYFGAENDKQLNLDFQKYSKSKDHSITNEEKIKEFLCKLLAYNPKKIKTLYQTLTDLRFLKKNEIEKHLDVILSRIDHCYSEVFKRKLEEIDYEEVEVCLNECIRILNTYKYIPITNDIISTLELYIGIEEDDKLTDDDIRDLLSKQ